jgi:hypothetical protein
MGRSFCCGPQVEELRSFYTKKLKESASRLQEAERKGDRCEELLRKKRGGSAPSRMMVGIWPPPSRPDTTIDAPNG